MLLGWDSLMCLFKSEKLLLPVLKMNLGWAYNSTSRLVLQVKADALCMLRGVVSPVSRCLSFPKPWEVCVSIIPALLWFPNPGMPPGQLQSSS